MEIKGSAQLQQVYKTSYCKSFITSKLNLKTDRRHSTGTLPETLGRPCQNKFKEKNNE